MEDDKVQKEFGLRVRNFTQKETKKERKNQRQRERDHTLKVASHVKISKVRENEWTNKKKVKYEREEKLARI